jgi:FMN reductase
MTTIAVISAGLSQPSSTRLLADRLAGAVAVAVAEKGQGSIQVVNVELRELAHDITNNLLTGFPSESLRQAIDSVVGADALITVTPVFSASYSGLFKSFFDVLDRDAIENKPTLIAATGGSARHSLALEYALRPLMSYLRARTVPTAVFAATEDFGAASSAAAGASLTGRISRAAGELIALLGDKPYADTADPFDLPLSFEELLNR